ncbi:hypothetical protein ABPG74_018920 [Tetrahymena malaccensis]
MKTTLILISLISLVSIFSFSSFKTNESLRSNNGGCYSSVLDLGAKVITITNSCQQNEAFKFSVIASYTSQTQQFNFETKCLQHGESQTFEMDLESSIGIFTQKPEAQTDC